MKGIQIITDEKHEKFEQEIFTASNLNGASTLKIGKEIVCKDFMGFGVAITGSSCYNLSIMDKEKRDELIKKVYSKDGLNLSVARLSIGSSDYSAELYSYDDVPNDEKLEHFSIDRDRAYVIPMIKEILKVRPDLTIFASPWSPPGWMKTGGSLGGGYMREKYVDTYADYIIKFVQAYEKEGIKIYGITPQNELETQQDGTMPACEWHPDIEAKFIKTLRAKLDKANIDLKIWAHDHNFINTKRVMWELDEYGLEKELDGIAFHYYNGEVEQTLAITQKYPSLQLHFTEAGPRLYDNYSTDERKWATMISRALKCGYKSFTGWNLVLNEDGGPNVGPFFCGGLITYDRRDGSFAYSGQYKAFSQIGPYINSKSVIYPISCEKKYGFNMPEFPKVIYPVEGFVVDNGTEKVIVLVNNNEQKMQTQFECVGQNWYVELMPKTLSTVIIK
jgi:glucosylceramidase